MIMKKYKVRIADKMLSRRLLGSGAVLIQGPKWCGKTTTAEQQAKSVVYMDDPEYMEQNVELANLSPKKLLSGEVPRLIDEWQLAPQLWDAARFEVDHRDELGQFIFTGSAVPVDTSKIHHSGTGRFAWLTMRTMSLSESGDSTNEVSLEELFANPIADVFATNPLNIDSLAWLICRGGWPKATMVSKEVALDMAYRYYEAVVHSDISRVDNVSRDPERAKRILRSLARNQCAQVTVNTICADLENNDVVATNRNTVASYIEALKKIFVLEDSLAWNPNLRSKTAIRTSDTRYFSDPSIGVAALGIGPNDLVNYLSTMGGILGSVLTGVFATRYVTGAEGVQGALYGDWHQLWIQVVATVVSIIYSIVVTYIIFKVVDKTVGVRVDKRVEEEGLDIYEHGESAYSN
jgi:uncharacterized protein